MGCIWTAVSEKLSDEEFMELVFGQQETKQNRKIILEKNISHDFDPNVVDELVKNPLNSLKNHELLHRELLVLRKSPKTLFLLRMAGVRVRV